MCVFTFLVLNEELVDMVTFVSLRFFFFFLHEELVDMVSDVCLHFLVLKRGTRWHGFICVSLLPFFTRGTGWHGFRCVSSLTCLKRGTRWHGFRRVSPLSCFYTKNCLAWFQMCVFTSLVLNEELGDMVSDVCLHFLVLNEELVDMVSDVCLH